VQERLVGFALGVGQRNDPNGAWRAGRSSRSAKSSSDGGVSGIVGRRRPVCREFTVTWKGFRWLGWSEA